NQMLRHASRDLIVETSGARQGGPFDADHLLLIPEAAMRPFKTALVFSALLAATPLLAQETREVETSQGTITSPAEPERVIVLNSSLAGSVYALGIDVLAVSGSNR